MTTPPPSVCRDERFFRTVMDSLADAVMIVDLPSLRVSAVNTTFLAESGLTEEEVIGKSVHQVAHSGAFGSIHSGGICPLLETLSHERISVAQHASPDGRGGIRYIEVTTTPVRDVDGKVVQIVHLSRDITLRHQAEEKVRSLARDLNRANRELALANDDLKQFAYIVSHDMRAPLVSIKGFSSELSGVVEELLTLIQTGEPLPPERIVQIRDDIREALQFIDAATTRLDGMINAILKLARLGYREFRSEPVDPGEIVHEILQSVAHQIEEKGVTVTVGTLPPLTTDRTALQQILGNLIDNALKYLDPGRRGELAISGERGDDAAVRFSVSDNGRGIDAADLPKIFDIFRRVGRQDVAGEGMGLAYVKAVVKRLQGEIACQSAPGVGTTFTVTIPDREGGIIP
ncbi:MAG: hypothetical protein Fur0034_06390 [Desulfuromonadia bacterium]